MAYRRTPRIQARIDAQRASLVDAAAAVLAESGYAGCTVSAVAARAGVATGTVYNHFASKGQLVVEGFRRGVATGELPEQNASVVAAALVGALGGALVGPLATGADDAETVPTLIEFTLRAIGARA